MQVNLSKFNRCNILVVGDLMIDEYLWGDVNRISPEAPVQIVSVNRETIVPGGAGNVANNLVALDANVHLAGVIGVGDQGKLLLNQLEHPKINLQGVFVDAKRPTTRKTRVVANSQQVLRIDRETVKPISSQALQQLGDYIETKMPLMDLVLISDYGKGVVNPSLLARLVSAAKRHSKITIADPKGLDFIKYRGITLLTPNQHEAALVAQTKIVDEKDLFRAAQKIKRLANVETLLITRGKKGMALFQSDKPPYFISSKARQVYDVSGAGDTVLAVLGLALASGATYKNATTLANNAAGIVVAKMGTATVNRVELSLAIEPYVNHAELKHKSLFELKKIIENLRHREKRIVLTNGCFDFLHGGHIDLFNAARQFGDVLIVALDNDASVRQLKGPGRPVINARERIRILCALDSIDFVTLFSPGELETLLKEIQPDVLVKGSNYTTQEVLGREVVEQNGGRVELVPITSPFSSTRIINTIRSGNET